MKINLVSFMAILAINLNAQKSNFDTLYNNLFFKYNVQNDTFSIKLLDFIKNNIDIHYTDNYSWTDSVGNSVNFDELNYIDFGTAVNSFEVLKIKKGKLIPKLYRKTDKSAMTLEILEECIEATSKKKNNLLKVPDKITLEYLLAYRIFSEPLYNWRKPFYNKFRFFHDSLNHKKTIRNIIENVNQWFVCTYGIEKRSDPIPFLGSLQLIHRKKGGCEDAANLMAFALRSIGIPCAVDVIPFWGTSSGGHVLNTAFDLKGNFIHFDALINSDSLYELVREPAKIFRKTYSKNISTLPNFCEINDIPDYGLLRSSNYEDVTKEYSKVTDIVFSVPDSINDKIIYTSIFNGGKWKPVWYSHKKDSIATFTDMVEGVVYLPVVFAKNKLIPVGNPKAFSNGKITSFIPTKEKISIKTEELAGYLKFKPGVVYALYYWDKRWIMIQRKIARAETKSFNFHNVPKNALLILRPIDSQGKERPFTINDKGERLWW